MIGNIVFKLKDKRRKGLYEGSKPHTWSPEERGAQLCSKCYLCGKDSESVYHVFLPFEVTEGYDNFLKHERDQIRHASGYWRTINILEQHERDCGEEDMVECNCFKYLVDGRNLRCFEGRNNSIQKFKMNCLFYFSFLK